MSYDIYADKDIQIRSFVDNNAPRYLVNGTAVVANKKHIYERIHDKNGNLVKLKKNLFTSHFVESMKRQAKNKAIFVDSQHELARESAIRTKLKEKSLSPDEIEHVMNMVKRKKLPLAKLNDVEVLGNPDTPEDPLRFRVYTELNTAFREVDDEHRHYFDAVWSSLEKGFLNGISINFGEFKYKEDNEGDLVIDDGDIFGVSYVDAPSFHEHSIDEVMIRSLEDVTKTKGELEMNEELEKEKAKLAEERKSIDAQKAEIAKQKEDMDKVKEAIEREKSEATKKAEKEALEKKEKDLKEQADKQTKFQKDLDKRSEEFAKKEKELQEKIGAKGIMTPAGNPNAPSRGAGTPANPTPEFYQENLKDITKDHDETMKVINEGKMPMIDKRLKGFSYLANLQTKIDQTAGMDEKDAQYIKDNRLLLKSPRDVVVYQPQIA